MKGRCCRCGFVKNVLFYKQVEKGRLEICNDCLKIEEKNKALIIELIAFRKVIYGDSPDTTNLNSYKGLIKNQFTILLKNMGLDL